MHTDFGLVLSCEHARNRIPSEFLDLFKGSGEILQTHRGYDPGAFKLATTLASGLNVPLFHTRVSRLLIEANRSTHHPNLFSNWSKTLPQPIKNQILLKYYIPFRAKVRNQIDTLLDQKQRVVHLSIHTFTPELDGRVRNADIGLLYDPKRKPDKDFCSHWRNMLLISNPELKIRMNYPYLGVADSHVTYLRKEYPVDRYISMELEVNQKFPHGDQKEWKSFRVCF